MALILEHHADVSACIFHPVPPPLEMLWDRRRNTWLREGENTCLTYCHLGLKREPYFPHAEPPIITERLWQSNGRPFRDICVCVCCWRAVNATLHNRCVWLTKPSEITSRICEKLLRLEKMCVTSFCVDWLHAVIRETAMKNLQWLVLWTF